MVSAVPGKSARTNIPMHSALKGGGGGRCSNNCSGMGFLFSLLKKKELAIFGYYESAWLQVPRKYSVYKIDNMYLVSI